MTAYDTVVVRSDALGDITVGTPAAENSREGFIEVSSLTTVEQMVSYGEQWLAGNQETVDKVTVKINPQSEAVTPFLGVGKGDALKHEGRSGAVETGRVYSRGFTGLRRNGTPDWYVTLGSASELRQVANQRILTKSAEGSMRGSFAASAPSPAPSFGDLSTSALPTIDLPVADADEMSTLEPADRTKPYRFTQPAAIIRFRCTAESLVGSDDSVFSLWKIIYSGGNVASETELEQFTWPGDKKLYQSLCDHPFATDEGYQLRVITAGAHALFTIQPVGSSTN